ncbi:MAG TPA: hypothetical protein VII44_02540 [Puia sp.]
MKKNVNSTDELAQLIAELELKAETQKKDIQETFSVVSENLKPLNLVRSGLRSVFSEEHRGDLIKAIFGLGTGILSRKLLFGRSKGFVGKTMGKAVEWGIAGLVSNNAEKIKEKAGVWIDKIFKKKPVSNHTPDPTPRQITH